MTVLITGATSGIGAAFAELLAAEGQPLILVARGEDRLAEQARRLGNATALAADLSTEAGQAAVAERLRAGDDPVDLLINSAGMSLNKGLLRSSVEDEERLLALNVTAVLRLTHAVLPGMVARHHGGIINVASVSAFGAVMPGSTYPPSKAWVTSFSESVGRGVRRYGVHVMALCPGYTRTEFHDRSGVDMSRTPDWMWLRAEDVARTGLRDLRRGRYVSVPDVRYKLMVFGLKHTPRGLFRRVSRDTRGGGTGQGAGARQP